MPANHAHLKLGKHPPKRDERTLRLATYLDKEKLPPPPEFIDYAKNLKEIPMLLNDKIGNCTIAAALHMQAVFCSMSGRPFRITDDEALEAYRRICGFDPSQGMDENNPTDQGGNMLDVLNAWRKDGIGKNEDGSPNKIRAFVQIDTTDLLELRTAIQIFGAAYIGNALPESAQNQDVWTPVRGSRGAPNSWGGHATCIPTADFQPHHRHLLTCLTWDIRKSMTTGFNTKYLDEGYVVVTDDWLDDKGKSPDGLDVDGLLADLKKVTQVGRPRKVESPSRTGGLSQTGGSSDKGNGKASSK